jgi:ketosteroid isomerase-like protein
MSSDEEKIRQILKAREEAIARGDAHAVISPLAKNIVVYDLPPPLLYEGEAARSVGGLQSWFETWDGPVQVTADNPAVIISGHLAVAFGLSRMRGNKKKEGALDQWFRSTVVLARHDGDWRIVHEHVSFPMKMDGSGKAATDLQPE